MSLEITILKGYNPSLEKACQSNSFYIREAISLPVFDKFRTFQNKVAFSSLLKDRKYRALASKCDSMITHMISFFSGKISFS